ncbi:MAG: hypothetical protein KDD29_09965 [Flavobacteriales bacterium]|nr:hypothetical protein [Flavobacteriales bacterium]
MTTLNIIANSTSKEVLEYQLSKLSTEVLKNMATLLKGDFREGADILFELTLNELQYRMGSDSFVEFLTSIDADY